MQNNPERPEDGTHTIEFSRELWIERADFKEVADKKFFRMAVGKETRLKSAYIVDCTWLQEERRNWRNRRNLLHLRPHFKGRY